VSREVSREDPMHRFGRCTCYGDGTCEYCTSAKPIFEAVLILESPCCDTFFTLQKEWLIAESIKGKYTETVIVECHGCGATWTTEAEAT